MKIIIIFIIKIIVQLNVISLYHLSNWFFKVMLKKWLIVDSPECVQSLYAEEGARVKEQDH